MCRLFFSLLILAVTARAELHWERPVKEFERSTDDREISATFSFQNTGTAPVTIRSVRSSCGCTTVQLSKRTYAPGESGEVIAKFVFGNRVGPHRKIITVKTDDGAPPTILDLRVTLRERVTIIPTLIYWSVGEANTPKSAQITVFGEPLMIKSVTSSNPRLSTRLQTVAAGEKYTLAISPLDTAERQSGKIEVVVDGASDKPRSYPIYVRIK